MKQGYTTYKQRNNVRKKTKGQYQADKPCTACGSWYRIDGKCNRCNAKEA